MSYGMVKLTIPWDINGDLFIRLLISTCVIRLFEVKPPWKMYGVDLYSVTCAVVDYNGYLHLVFSSTALFKPQNQLSHSRALAQSGTYCIAVQDLDHRF